MLKSLRNIGPETYHTSSLHSSSGSRRAQWATSRYKVSQMFSPREATVPIGSVPARGMRLTTLSEIDTSYYVLTVDLWSVDGSKEVNLVRHSATSPSISATTSSSYPPPPAQPPNFPYGPPMTQVHVGLAQGYPQPGQYGAYPPASGAQYPPASQAYPQHPSYPAAGGPPPEQRPEQTQSYYTTAGGTPITPTNYYNSPSQGPLLSPSNGIMQTQDPRSAPAGMFTRNLIGSLCVSAFKLTDPEGKLGVWFILQDLSVRTEGAFR